MSPLRGDPARNNADNAEKPERPHHAKTLAMCEQSERQSAMPSDHAAPDTSSLAPESTNGSTSVSMSCACSAAKA